MKPLDAFVSEGPVAVPSRLEADRVHEALGKPSGGPTEAWLTGTGTPAIVVGRSGPSNVVRCGEQVMVVDCGNGVLAQVLRLGFAPRDVTHVFITHHHVDHNADLGYLLVAPWTLKGVHRPPVVLGPAGTYEYTRRVLAAQDFDLRVREGHGFVGAAAAPPVVELTDGDVIRGDRVRVTAFAVDHAPVEPALGYRFDTDDVSIVFSGDTKPCDNLVRHATRADILVHEALCPGFGFADYHTSSHDVGRVAAAARVDELVLTHLIPGNRPDEDWLSDVVANYDGPVRVGYDLLRLTQ